MSGSFALVGTAWGGGWWGGDAGGLVYAVPVGVWLQTHQIGLQLVGSLLGELFELFVGVVRAGISDARHNNLVCLINLPLRVQPPFGVIVDPPAILLGSQLRGTR